MVSTLNLRLFLLSHLLLGASPTSPLSEIDTYVGCAYSSKLNLTPDQFMGRWNSSYVYTGCKEQAYNNNETLFIIRNKDECFTTNDNAISNYIKSDFGGCDVVIVDGVSKSIGSNNQPAIYDMYEETSRSAVYQIPRVLDLKIERSGLIAIEELECPVFRNDYIELNLHILRISLERSLSDPCFFKSSSESIKSNILEGCNGQQRCNVLGILPHSCLNMALDIQYMCLYSSKPGIPRVKINRLSHPHVSVSSLSFNQRILLINICVIVLIICLFLLFKFCLMKYSPIRHFCWPLHEVVPCLGLFPKGIREPDQREPVYERPAYRPIHVEEPKVRVERPHPYSFLPPFSFFKNLNTYDSNTSSTMEQSDY